ncbi:MAG: oligosaccharide flippase family protein [Planctomycetota bacterium]|jgi:O-antigen/teichoic acid export membrane protein
MRYKLKINLLASWGHHGINILIGLVLMPFVLNTVGDANYGLWLFICSIAGYSGLMNLGFGNTICRFVAHHHAKNEIDDVNRVVNVVASIYLLMSGALLALAGALAWLAPYLYDWGETSITEIRWVITLLGLNVVVGLLGSVFGGVIIGLQRIDLERGFQSLAGIGRLALTLILLQKEHALVTLALIFLLTTLIENVGYVAIVFRQLPGLKLHWRYFDRGTLKTCFGFSMYSLLDFIAYKLIEATDTVVIGLVFGTSYIVPYYIAHRLMTFIVQPLQMVGSVLMPRGAELGAHNHDHRLRVLVQKGLGLSFLLTAGVTIGAYFFGDQVIQAWIGRSYSESQLLLVVLLAAQILATPMRVLRGVLFGMGHVQMPAVLYFIEAVANIGLTLLLVQPLGLLGVALGTAIPVFVVELFAFLPYALNKLNFPLRRFALQVLLPQVPALLALWLYSMAVSSQWAVTAAWVPVLLVSGGGGAVLGLTWLASRRATRHWQLA